MNTRAKIRCSSPSCRCIVCLFFVLCLTAVSLNSQVWDPDVRLTTAGVASVRSSIAISDQNLHVAWSDYRDGSNAEIYYKRSSDNGQTWTPGDRISNDPSQSQDPSIAAFENNVHIVWMDDRDGNYEIYYRRSTNNGDFFHPEVRLTTAGSGTENPSIAINDNTIHIVWADYRDGNREIYYKRSTDNGLSWTSGMRLTNDSATSSSPRIAVFGGNVYAVWTDYRHGNGEVYLKHSSDGGNSWGPDERLTFSGAGVYTPVIAVLESTVHIAWSDLRNSSNGEIYYKRSLDSGTTWSETRRLTFDAADSQSPSISAFLEKVHIVWYDERDINREIYYKGSIDNGESWGEDQKLTNQSAESRIPSIAAFGGDIYVVWEDSRDGNFEIYYKHGAMPVGVEELGDTAPEDFTLSQNYPNPFNTETSIRYCLPRQEKVNVAVFDLLGREIEVLVDSEQKAGYHTVKWNASEWASGIYFYTFTTGAYSITRKMLLLK